MHHGADASTCYSSLKLSDLVGYLDATNRVPVRTAAAVVRISAAADEAEVVGVAAVRTGGPVVAVAASTVGKAVAVAAVAGSREEHKKVKNT